MNIPGGRRALVAIGVVLLAGAAGAGLVLIDGDDDEEDAATTTTSLATSTTTTTLFAATSSTTAATTSTTARATTSTSASTSSTSSTTVTTVAPTSACGSGKAGVSFTAKDLVTDAVNSSFTPQATVDNQVNQAIEVEEIEIQVVYPGGETRTVRFTTAGTVINPGTSASFTADRLTTVRRYDSVKFSRFTYFTQGRQSTCRVTTP